MAGYSDIPVHAVHPSQLSAYSSLAGALTPATPISQFSSSTRERVPQTACKGVSDPVFAPIRFDYFSQARQGVALRDFSSRSGLPQLISGANEHVLAGIKIHKIDPSASGWAMSTLMVHSHSLYRQRSQRGSSVP